MEELNDFGFTCVDEDELEVAQTASAATTNLNSTQDKLDALYNAMTPLLNNLKANPSKEYILWPNRLEKVEEFETHLQNIYKG